MDPVIVILTLTSGIGMGAALTSLYVWCRTRDEMMHCHRMFMDYLDSVRMSKDMNLAALLIRTSSVEVEDEESEGEGLEGEDGESDPFGDDPDWWKNN